MWNLLPEEIVGYYYYVSHCTDYRNACDPTKAKSLNFICVCITYQYNNNKSFSRETIAQQYPIHTDHYVVNYFTSQHILYQKTNPLPSGLPFNLSMPTESINITPAVVNVGVTTANEVERSPPLD